MSLDQRQEKFYPQNPQSVFQAAIRATEKLQGAVVSSSPENLRIEAKFPKTILGKTLGERTYLSCEVRPQGEGSQVMLDAYPLDALERKLMFGARKGVTQTLISWFTAHLENQLGVKQG